MDKITLERIKTIHPLLRVELNMIYREICSAITTPYAMFRFSQVFRTFAQQESLYAQGRTKSGPIVTNAKGGESYHNYGLAVDIVELLDKDKNGTFETASWDTLLDADKDGVADWLEVVKIFEAYGWQWGLFKKNGQRYDLPHFQKTFGYTISDLKKMPKDYNNYPIIPSDNLNNDCKCKCN